MTTTQTNSKLVCDQLHRTMAHIVTAYDIKESKKRGYNRYAIGMYLGAVQEVCAELEANPELLTRSVIISHFNGRLCDAILRGLGFNPQTKDELNYALKPYEREFKSKTGAEQFSRYLIKPWPTYCTDVAIHCIVNGADKTYKVTWNGKF